MFTTLCIFIVGPPYTFRLKVKFYSSEPHNLREELTRYQFFLQLKQDILTEKLKPPPETLIELSALVLQCKQLLSCISDCSLIDSFQYVIVIKKQFVFP